MYMIWRGTRCGVWAMLQQPLNTLWCTRHAQVRTGRSEPTVSTQRPRRGGNLQGVVQWGGRLRVNPGACRAGTGRAMFGYSKDLMGKSGSYKAWRGVFRVLCMRPISRSHTKKRSNFDHPVKSLQIQCNHMIEPPLRHCSESPYRVGRRFPADPDLEHGL